MNKLHLMLWCKCDASFELDYQLVFDPEIGKVKAHLMTFV